MSFFGTYYRKAKRSFKEALLTDGIDEAPLSSKLKLSAPACCPSNEDGFESTSENNYQGEKMILSTLGQGFASRAAAAASDCYSLGRFPWVSSSEGKALKTSIPSPRHGNRSGTKIRVRRPFYRTLDSAMDATSEYGKSSSSVIQVLKELTTKSANQEISMDVSNDSKSNDTNKSPIELQHNLFMSQLENSVENVTESTLNETAPTTVKNEGLKRRHVDSSLRDEIYSSLSSSLGMFNGKPIKCVGSPSPKAKKVKRMKTKTCSVGIQTAEKPKETRVSPSTKQVENSTFETPMKLANGETKEDSPVSPKAPLIPAPVSETTAKVILKSALSKFQKTGLLEEGRPVGLPTIGPPILPEYEKPISDEKVSEEPSDKVAATFSDLTPVAPKQDPPTMPVPSTEAKTFGFQLPMTASSTQLAFGDSIGGTLATKPDGNASSEDGRTKPIVSLNSGFQFTAPAKNKTAEIEKTAETNLSRVVTTTAAENSSGGFTFTAPSERKEETKLEGKVQEFSLIPPMITTTSSFTPVTTASSTKNPQRVGGFSFTPAKSTGANAVLTATTTSTFSFGTVGAKTSTVPISTTSASVATPSNFKFSFGTSPQQTVQTQAQPQPTFQSNHPQLMAPTTTTAPLPVKETSNPVFSLGSSENKFSFSSTPATSTQPVFSSTSKFSFSTTKLNSSAGPVKLDGFPPVTKEESKPIQPAQNIFSFGGSNPVTTSPTTTVSSPSAFSFGGSSLFGAKPSNTSLFSGQQSSNTLSFPTQQGTFGSTGNPPAFGSTPLTTTSSSLFPSFNSTTPKTTAFAFGASSFSPSASVSTTSSITKPLDSPFKFGQTNGPSFNFTSSQPSDKPITTTAPTFGSSTSSIASTPSFGLLSGSISAPAFSFGGSSTFGGSSSTGPTAQGSASSTFPPVTSVAPPAFGSITPSLQTTSSFAPGSSSAQPPPPAFGSTQSFAFGSGGGSASKPSAGQPSGSTLFQFGSSSQLQQQQPFSFSAGVGTAQVAPQGFGFPTTGFGPVGGAMFNIGSGTVTPRSRHRQRKK